MITCPHCTNVDTSMMHLVVHLPADPPGAIRFIYGCDVCSKTFEVWNVPTSPEAGS